MKGKPELKLELEFGNWKSGRMEVWKTGSVWKLNDRNMCKLYLRPAGSRKDKAKGKPKPVRILKPEIVEPSARQPTDALTHISPTKDSAQQ